MIRFVQAKRIGGKFYRIRDQNSLSFSDFLFQEKLNQRKYSKYSHLADKFEVRKYVSDMIGAQYLIPLVGCFSDIEELNKIDIGNGVIIKANHGSGWNM
ncbi:hypothetical protein N9H17_07010, partial [Schleiferiaceae bacterium]|nr:hypothetical protein [Schleiferiaceae bacterium]